jgi:hypothetical protein
MLKVVAVTALLAMPLLQSLVDATHWTEALHSHVGQQWAARTAHEHSSA